MVCVCVCVVCVCVCGVGVCVWCVWCVCVCVCVILYGEWPSTRALGARLQWPGKHLTSVLECEWWKKRDKYSPGSHSSAWSLMNLSIVPAVGTQVLLRWSSVWPEVVLPVVHNAAVVVLKAEGRILQALLVEVRFELWKEKRTNQLSVDALRGIWAYGFNDCVGRRAVWYKFNDVSKGLVASVFRNVVGNIRLHF